MKTRRGYKSLLFASGLLLVLLPGLGFHKPGDTTIVKPLTAEKRTSAPPCITDSACGSIFSNVAGKLFPVLKSLNLM